MGRWTRTRDLDGKHGRWVDIRTTLGQQRAILHFMRMDEFHHADGGLHIGPIVVAAEWRWPEDYNQRYEVTLRWMLLTPVSASVRLRIGWPRG